MNHRDLWRASLTLLLVVTACQRGKNDAAGSQKEAVKAESSEIEPGILAAFAPLPKVMESKDNPLSEAKVDLGRMLYYENRLSKNHDLSCNSCHLLDKYGVDGRKVSSGHKAQMGVRNSTSSYNAAGHFVQFWDGRAKDVEEQAKGPVLNPVEMAMPSEKAVEALLKSIPGYVDAFKKAYPESQDPVTYDHMAKAIGAFERKLVTPGRWDKFLAGDRSALSAAEKQGFKTFVGTGCVACHNGPYLGGASYQKLGNVKPWPNQKDQGRYEVSKNEADKMLFKVPSLRNVAKTAPYFHDGSIAQLPEAVRKMAFHQLGRTLSDEETRAIVAFLEALTGELPSEYIKKPELPASGPKTPKADLS